MSWRLKKTGFTLVELLAVSALVALLATVTLLRYAKMGSQTVLINQSRQLYLAAKYARIAAIEQQKPIALKLDETGRHIMLETVTSENLLSDPRDQSGRSIEANTTLPQVNNTYFHPMVLDDKLCVEQFTVDGVERSHTESLFYPDGTAQACAIQLGDGLHHASILITQAGRVKLQIGLPAEIQTGRIDLDQVQ